MQQAVLNTLTLYLLYLEASRSRMLCIKQQRNGSGGRTKQGTIFLSFSNEYGTSKTKLAAVSNDVVFLFDAISHTHTVLSFRIKDWTPTDTDAVVSTDDFLAIYGVLIWLPFIDRITVLGQLGSIRYYNSFRHLT